MTGGTVVGLSADLGIVWRALHQRFGSGATVTSVRVGPMSTAERDAVADLLGTATLPPAVCKIRIDQLDSALAEAVGMTTRQVVERAVGPIENRSAARAEQAVRRRELWDWLDAHPVVRAQPALGDWARAMRRAGIIGGSVDKTRDLLADALAVLQAIPAPGTSLPVFAEQTVRDPHALDNGTRLHTAVIRALAAIHNCDVPGDAVGLRGFWEMAGVADDELSSTVLTAGLRVAAPGSVLDAVLRVCAAAGSAASLTLQQVRGADRLTAVSEVVRVVENPSVLATALKRFGRSCPPIVCTAGWPSGAGIRLLDLLAAAGARLEYHGDFDGEGLRIAAHVIARTGAHPWRMSSADYLASVGSDGQPAGRVSEVPWDSDLAAHMRRTEISVPQERVVEILLDDLAS
ncbi:MULTISPECIES: TIGR02679 family protein [Nocardia]|uniref:TIGR02679 family protein n=2 Tax=Nocardia TaxID=1817 RepID=A0A2T2Z917_9NOCA|nr:MULTISPECIES: TIGR02679 family protein [Nocardia]MBF6446226.1 TIGR02679 family protein [Nocardia elegans]PSR64250.1 TIGR02679 family protein [Nocardia nova]